MSRYLISGVSRGIGRATAAQLVAAGHQVYGLVRDPESLPTILADLGLAGGAAADLSAADGLEAALRPMLDQWAADGGGDGPDGLDGLVHSAGVIRFGAVRDSNVRELAEQLAVNVTAVAELTRLLLPALRPRRGSVVFVNSGSGLVSRPDIGGYSASKFAVRALADALRGEEPDLRISSLYPGPTATDMQREVRDAQSEPYREADYLRVETVAGVICSMLSLPSDGVITELSLRPTGR